MERVVAPISESAKTEKEIEELKAPKSTKPTVESLQADLLKLTDLVLSLVSKTN